MEFRDAGCARSQSLKDDCNMIAVPVEQVYGRMKEATQL